ncbi:hypothetical protein [Paraburkholderia sacchari]|uniref:hypothetical protein n=1 Tax=Paraburkholderia sacchari TaxID=159450 RepID=UPI000542D1F6|nr:hypothetical protein [Paraburkholderia sacchari]NLP62903.1 hypothetical protein [Paraburkholderia sacchari]
MAQAILANLLVSAVYADRKLSHWGRGTSTAMPASTRFFVMVWLVELRKEFIAIDMISILDLLLAARQDHLSRDDRRLP